MKCLFENISRSAFAALLWVCGIPAVSGCGDHTGAAEGGITIADSQLTKTVAWNEVETSIEFSSAAPWSASCSDAATRAGHTGLSWLRLTAPKGSGGTFRMPLLLSVNDNDTYREAQVTITSGGSSVTVTVRQEANPDAVHTMSPSQIPDYDRFYCPGPGNDGFQKGPAGLLRSDGKWSWFRHRQSEHFIVFWEPGFGDDPNAESVPEALRVDVDDLLAKAEKFYDTNVNKLQMVRVGRGQSRLDKYKMEIFLLYRNEWLATGAGYDNVIGALWVNPSTCHPVGQTIAHEIGHMFQYQTYCDNILSGKPDDSHSGFRYGLPGSKGGNGFWEQCAQWQSFQDFPELALATHDLGVYFNHCHRHFEHEWMRYASYWFHYYAAKKHGYGVVGRLWNESVYPEDALQAYMRLYCSDDYETLRKELFDFAQRMATFDIDMDGVKNYYAGQDERFTSRFFRSARSGYRQIAYAKCPGATGFNVLPLDVPAEGTPVSVDLRVLPAGAALAADDPGAVTDADGKETGVTRHYNAVGDGQGAAYGFVALKGDGTRIYGGMNHTYSEGTASFVVPAGVEKLFLVVQGSPRTYRQCPWNDDETDDYQCPYEIRLNGTSLRGSFEVDTDKTPENLSLTYDVGCDAAASGYIQGTIDLGGGGDLKKICRALGLEPAALTARLLPVQNGATATPAEGKIAFGLLQPDNTVSHTYSSNGGFYVKADGSRGSWADGDPVWIEYDKEHFAITYGHYPGKSVAGTVYTVRPVLVYTRDGRQYRVTFTVNMRF